MNERRCIKNHKNIISPTIRPYLISGGSLIVGALLATLGWWESDRLDLLFEANPIEIDKITTTKNAKGDCTPGSKAKISTDGPEGSTVQELECVNESSPIQRLKWVKTKNGRQLVGIYKSGIDFDETTNKVIKTPVTVGSSGPRWIVKNTTTKPNPTKPNQIQKPNSTTNSL